ncbi:MAG: AhpC/TSA family protein [Bacteroidetes bacterium]|nr:MAG: AhpC/TSA family protein [Bacteroidota bacterium]
MFRRITTILFVSTILFSCGSKNDGKGKITGQFSNAQDIMVYLQKSGDEGDIILDSAKTDNAGNFVLKNAATQTDYFTLRTGDRNQIYLLLHGGENVTISGDANDLDKTYSIEGSEDSKLIQQLRSFELKLGDSLNSVYMSTRQDQPAAADSIGSILQKHYVSTMEEYSTRFINSNMNSLVALSATRFLNQDKNVTLLDDLGSNLDKKYPGNKYVKDYLAVVAELKKLPAGSPAPDFSLPDPSGKNISLSSFKGKVVLLDFWASWCRPCRKTNPYLVSLYNKYKDQGFEIFQVSLDDNADAWKDAIAKDGLKWAHASELKKWNSDVVKAYGIEAIPFTLLLDKEGNIISKGLLGEELDRKIQEALVKNS